MRTIKRLDLVAGMNHLTFPAGSELVSVLCVREVPRLCVGISTGPGGSAEIPHRVDLVPTGADIPKDAGRHLGSFAWQNSEWHAFEISL